MASSYFVTFGDNRLTFPGATGSVAWDAGDSPSPGMRTPWIASGVYTGSGNYTGVTGGIQFICPLVCTYFSSDAEQSSIICTTSLEAHLNVANGRRWIAAKDETANGSSFRTDVPLYNLDCKIYQESILSANFSSRAGKTIRGSNGIGNILTGYDNLSISRLPEGTYSEYGKHSFADRVLNNGYSEQVVSASAEIMASSGYFDPSIYGNSTMDYTHWSWLEYTGGSLNKYGYSAGASITWWASGEV